MDPLSVCFCQGKEKSWKRKKSCISKQWLCHFKKNVSLQLDKKDIKFLIAMSNTYLTHLINLWRIMSTTIASLISSRVAKSSVKRGLCRVFLSVLSWPCLIVSGGLIADAFPWILLTLPMIWRSFFFICRSRIEWTKNGSNYNLNNLFRHAIDD